MERYAWKTQVKNGMLDVYIERHANIWPELSQLLDEAGIHNYTIWNSGLDLFGYYECEYGIDHAQTIQANSEIVQKWNAYMEDIIELEMDPETGAQPLMRQVFFHK